MLVAPGSRLAMSHKLYTQRRHGFAGPGVRMWVARAFQSAFLGVMFRLSATEIRGHPNIVPGQSVCGTRADFHVTAILNKSEFGISMLLLVLISLSYGPQEEYRPRQAMTSYSSSFSFSSSSSSSSSSPSSSSSASDTSSPRALRRFCAM